MNDTNVSTAIIIILICHLSIFIIGWKTQKNTLLISCLNAVIAIGIFIFFAIDIVNLKQHNFELREIFVICMEVCILIFGLYTIMGFQERTYVKVINYIGFGIHLLATTGMLYFMLTFKFDRLF